MSIGGIPVKTKTNRKRTVWFLSGLMTMAMLVNLFAAIPFAISVMAAVEPGLGTDGNKAVAGFLGVE